jgi:hypothetical protein
MAVRKPLKKEEVDVEALISKGAEVIKDNTDKMDKKEKMAWKMLNLRIPESMLEEVDKLVEERIGMSRVAWILESIQEKLKRSS